MSTVRYKTAEGVADVNGPSPIIWANCPVDEFIEDPAKGLHYWNTWQDTDVVADTSVSGGYGLAGTNNLVDFRTGLVNVLDVETGATDNDESIVYKMFDTPVVELYNSKPFWFEARIAHDDVGDNGIFVGLIEEAGMAADLILDNQTGFVDEDYIGFGTQTDDDDGLLMLSHLTGATAQSPEGSPYTITDGTYYRLGIKWDGKETLEWFVDGVSQGTVTLAASMTNAMGIAFAIKTGAAAGVSLLVDWVRLAVTL
jgi:hypothetical protein